MNPFDGCLTLGFFQNVSHIMYTPPFIHPFILHFIGAFAGHFIGSSQLVIFKVHFIGAFSKKIKSPITTLIPLTPLTTMPVSKEEKARLAKAAEEQKDRKRREREEKAAILTAASHADRATAGNLSRSLDSINKAAVAKTAEEIVDERISGLEMKMNGVNDSLQAILSKLENFKEGPSEKNR